MFLSAIFLLGLSGAATYLSLSYFASSERLVSHTQEVRATVGELERDLGAAGRARTAYLMSNDESGLTDYRAAVSGITNGLRRLQNLTGDNAVQIDNCARMEATIKAREAEWEDWISQKRQNKPLDYSALVRQSLEQSSKTAVAANSILVEEDRLLAQRRKLAQRAFQLTGAVVIASFTLALLLLYFYQRSLRAKLQDQAAAEQAARDALKREMSLRQNEERFRLFIEAVRDYALFTLDAEGCVSSWNKGAERLKGYNTAEIMGKHFSCFYPEEDREKKPAIEIAGAIRDGRFEDEGWRIRKDGSRFWANVVLTAMRDQSGRLIGFAKVTRDFSERRVAQEALRRANIELLSEVAERKSAEQMLANSEKSLRELSVHLLRAQDEERRRIGRDLHDSVGQYLAALKMTLDSVSSAHASNPNGIAQQLAHCIYLTEEAIKEVRTISYLLYPPMLEEMGLRSAIPWYLDGFSKRSNIRTTFEVDPHLGRLDRNVELALFRVLQEGITNVHRHSGSADAAVRLCLTNGNVVMEIRDYGKGIPSVGSDRGEDRMSSFGVGLRGMSERVRQLGGTLEVSGREQGTIVRAMIPAGKPLSQAAKTA